MGRIDWREFFNEIKGKKIVGGKFTTINYSGSYFLKEEYETFTVYSLIRNEDKIFEILIEK